MQHQIPMPPLQFSAATIQVSYVLCIFNAKSVLNSILILFKMVKLSMLHVETVFLAVTFAIKNWAQTKKTV